MCCFSGPVRSVGGTRIFARELEHGRQLLAYAMHLDLEFELAMVLPLPVEPGSSEGAVEFRDLSGYAHLFDDLEALFPLDAVPAARAHPQSFGVAELLLEVHRVGAFEASFVPTVADFVRLDPRFRLSPELWQRLPHYADYGFAVFKLAPTRGWFGSRAQEVHPMAFSFPRRDPDALFFPTVHVHDGAVHQQAHFDHLFYCQPSAALSATLDWTRSPEIAGSTVAVAKSAECVDGTAFVYRTALFGSLPNQDWVLRAPDLDPGLWSGAGTTHRYEARCRWANAFSPATEPHRTWQRTSSARFRAIQQALSEGLPALCDAHREDWKLSELTSELPAHFMNGPQLFRGTSYRDGSSRLEPGPCQVSFTAFSNRVEPQHVVLAFSELPTPAVTQRIQSELATLLDRAVAN